MKKYILSLAVPAVALLMGACSKDTENTTWITYYPNMTLEGGTQMTWQAGVPFVDPGISVIMNGEDVTDQISITTSMDLNSPKEGMYSVNYGYVTPDGITATASREVLVVGSTAPLAGYYANVDGECYYYESDPKDAETFVNNNPVSFVGAGENTYVVSDLMGRSMQYWYSWDNQCPGTIVINSDNTLELTKAVDNGWGVDPFIRTWEDAKYDPATKTFSWLCKPYWGTSPYIHIEYKLIEE